MSGKYRQLPPLNALVVFEAAFRLQNFTQAGDELALSQASVSRRVRELEANLGVRLFERKRYNVVPTIEGEILADAVRSTLDDLAITSDRLRNRRKTTDQFTIYSDISLTNALITPVMGEFQQLHPKVSCNVLSSSDPIGYTDKAFDVGLQYDRLFEDRFKLEPLADEIIFPVCSPKFASRLQRDPEPGEIAQQPLLNFEDYRREWISWKQFLSVYGAKESTQRKKLTFSSYAIYMDMTERGEGIALGWACSVKNRIETGRLVRISNMSMTIKDGINVYRPKTAETNSVADQFVELLRNKLSRMEK